MLSPGSRLTPRVLVAPLDWGLGHATRCIPLVHELLRQGCEVVLAGEGGIRWLLQAEFGEIRFLRLPGYGIRYTDSGRSLVKGLARQLPRLLRVIKEEHRWLQKVVEEEGIDLVISDNRYGLYHPTVPSVILTHQLLVQTGYGPRADRWLQRLHYRFLNRFHQCWVPDAPGEENLGGLLSHPDVLPRVPVFYTGPLSRFTNSPGSIEKGPLLVVLSGPEPQRSLLERQLLRQLVALPRETVLVRGLLGERDPVHTAKQITVFNYLTSDPLRQLMAAAPLVICRSGYSTIMDLAALNKKAVLIPTPGQTEQLYLGHYLQEKGQAFCYEQSEFDLFTAVVEADGANRRLSAPAPTVLAEVVTQLLEKLYHRRAPAKTGATG
jgi:UDP:flavonoid glycosyltransferase YjiC (YdhE family)